VEHTTLGSDTGEATSPLPSEVFGKVAHELVANGVAERDVRRMLSRPASLPAYYHRSRRACDS
jgi:hypothetical protein